MELYSEQILKVIDKDNPTLAKQTLDEVAADYKVRLLKSPGHRPNLSMLCKNKGISRYKYDILVGLVGDIEKLHEYFKKDIQIASGAVEDLMNNIIVELKKRLPEMANKELIDLYKVNSEISAGPKVDKAAITNINFDLDQHLQKRFKGVDVDSDFDTSDSG